MGHGAREDGGHRADKQREVEGVAPADNVGRQAPEDGAHEHADVGRDGEPVGVAPAAEFLVGLPRDDGLEEEDERVDCVAVGAIIIITCELPRRFWSPVGRRHVTSNSPKPVQTKQFPVIVRPSNLINGLV